MTKKLTTHQFLKRIWRLQRTDGYAFLTWFDDLHDWQDTNLRVVEQAARLPDPLPSTHQKLNYPDSGTSPIVIDLYFAPCLFRDTKRRKENALPGRWLYADLDEVSPYTLTLKPTIAWETSPGRYQAMWLLTKPLKPDTLAKLNQHTTYYTGADKGGWSLTKVLRVPGSVSHKRDDPFTVKLLWFDTDIEYNAKKLYVRVKSAAIPGSTLPEIKNLNLPSFSPEGIMRKRQVPARVRKLYKAKQARGDRSARLWLLENLLLKAGCTPEETLVVVKATVWNKYKGQRREVTQLWTEISKAAASLQHQSKSKSASKKRSKRSARTTSSTQRKSKRTSKTSKSKRLKKSRSKTEKSTSSSNRKSRKSPSDSSSYSSRKSGLGVSGYNEFLGRKLKKPGWLVEGIWSEQAHGVLAGEAKTYKSVISTDLAISVASGTPFLGTFEIPATGPVIMIQEENDEGETQDRLRRIANSRGLLGKVSMEGDSLHVSSDVELPIHLLNNTGFDLTDNDNLMELAVTIKQTGAKLVILDPFYLMTPGVDENSAVQVSPILRKLLHIKQRLDCGILLIHHYKKQSSMNPIYGAARMSGTGVFHRWFESAVYVEKNEKQSDMVRILPDHRAHRARAPIRIRFDLGTDEDLYYKAIVSNAKADKAILHERLVELLGEKEGWTISELRVAMGMNNANVLREMLGDHGYTLNKVKSGKKGRPKLVVTPLDKAAKRAVRLEI